MAASIDLSRSENVESSDEQEAMTKSMKIMKTSPEYLEEADEIMESLNSELPIDEPEWWAKKFDVNGKTL
jgi:hypothetical protein